MDQWDGWRNLFLKCERRLLVVVPHHTTSEQLWLVINTLEYSLATLQQPNGTVVKCLPHRIVIRVRFPADASPVFPGQPDGLQAGDFRWIAKGRVVVLLFFCFSRWTLRSERAKVFKKTKKKKNVKNRTKVQTAGNAPWPLRCHDAASELSGRGYSIGV